jgi:hypothetical protein
LIAELETGDLPVSNGTIVANPRRRCGDHEFALVGKDQGSTENKKSREPRNTPKPRKQGINGAKIVSVCSVCSVVEIRDNDSTPGTLAKRVGSIRQILCLQPLGMKSFVFEPPLTQRLRVAFWIASAV